MRKFVGAQRRWLATGMGGAMGGEMSPRVTSPLGRLADEEYKGVREGTGGRHSRGGRQVTVFGATGFLGQYVVNYIGQLGHNVIVATRGDDMEWRHLKLATDYGKLACSYINIKDEGVMRETIAGSDVVINLMGKYYETKHYAPNMINCSFKDVHVDGAEMVARLAREEECYHLVHMSCAYQNTKSASEFARTKAEGEERVKAQFPGAVIVRPNVMYGEEDNFLNLYARIANGLPYVPLVEGEALVRPVFVDDVARAVSTAADNFVTAGKTINLSGRHAYTHKQVLEYIMEQIDKRKEFVEIPLNLALRAGKIFNMLPSPLLTHDTISLMMEDCPGPSAEEISFQELGVEDLADFETKGYNFLFRYREGGHFSDLRRAEQEAKA